jgi:hypothetical protein
MKGVKDIGQVLLDMEAAKDENTIFLNVVLVGNDEENYVQGRAEFLRPEEEYERWLERQDEKREQWGQPQCVSAEEEKEGRWPREVVKK